MQIDAAQSRMVYLGFGNLLPEGDDEHDVGIRKDFAIDIRRLEQRQFRRGGGRADWRWRQPRPRRRGGRVA